MRAVHLSGGVGSFDTSTSGLQDTLLDLIRRCGHLKELSLAVLRGAEDFLIEMNMWALSLQTLVIHSVEHEIPLQAAALLM